MEDILTEFEEKEEVFTFWDEVNIIILFMALIIPYCMYCFLKFLIKKIYNT